MRRYIIHGCGVAERRVWENVFGRFQWSWWLKTCLTNKVKHIIYEHKIKFTRTDLFKYFFRPSSRTEKWKWTSLLWMARIKDYQSINVVLILSSVLFVYIRSNRCPITFFYSNIEKKEHRSKEYNTLSDFSNWSFSPRKVKRFFF